LPNNHQTAGHFRAAALAGAAARKKGMGMTSMSRGVHLLDKAVEIAHREMAALESGDYDEAARLADRRGEIISQAWNALETDTTDQYRSRLVSLTRLQERLTALAGAARDAVRGGLQRSRLEKQRMRGYHQAIGQAMQ
jgi:hypothetical protein